MSKKKWTLLIAGILLLAGYWKLFYKTWSNRVVAANADCVVALDVKRLTNTIIWNIITTPSQWKLPKSFGREEDEVSWDDMVKLPDFVFLFHAKDQPANAWYTVLEINDRDDFEKGLRQFHFEKKTDTEYFSKELGIEFIQQGNRLLVGNGAVSDKNHIRAVATQLFSKQQFMPKEILQKNVDAASHLSVVLGKNQFLQQDGIIKVNLLEEKIAVSGMLIPARQYHFSESDFNYSTGSLFTLLFTQPTPEVYALIPAPARTGISKALNFDVDSMLLPGNSSYQLDIHGLQQRTDSAISYSYDDNFNPVETVVVNQVTEPAFNFSIQGGEACRVYEYWIKNEKIEKTPAGELFIPVPFVKSYCSRKTERELAVTSGNYQRPNDGQPVRCIGFTRLLIADMPAAVRDVLPGVLTNNIKNIQSVELLAKKQNEQFLLEGSINKKKNDQPFFDW